MAQVAPAAVVVSSCVTTNVDHLTNNETVNVTALELQRNRRVLYFSDGTMEESSSSDSDDNDTLDKGLDAHINENDLTLLSRFKYRASKVGANVLAGIDYVGGGLASFFGITAPKYASELDYYYDQARVQRDREVDGRWLSVGTSGAEIITRDHPRRDINRNNIP